MKIDPLKPSPALLAKLGSLVYHLEELLDEGHEFDRAAAQALRESPDVEAWFHAMKQLALLPVKRRVK